MNDGLCLNVRMFFFSAAIRHRSNVMKEKTSGASCGVAFIQDCLFLAFKNASSLATSSLLLFFFFCVVIIPKRCGQQLMLNEMIVVIIVLSRNVILFSP